MNFFEKLRSGNDITIEFVGDSITYGCQYCTIEETFPAVFARLVAEKFSDATVRRYDGYYESELGTLCGFEDPVYVSNGGKRHIDIIKNGIGGNTVRRAINRIDDFTNEMPNGKRVDLMIFMYGINDAMRSDPQKFTDIDTFEKNYNELIDLVMSRKNTDIAIMTPTYINVRSYSERVAKVSNERGAILVDQYAMWAAHYVEGVENHGQGDWLSNPKDACHTSPKGAEAIGRLAFDTIFCDNK